MAVKMSRSTQVSQELARLTRGISQTDLTRQRAFSAGDLALNLGLARNAASHELNLLWKRGLAVKKRGRPVLFLHRETLENLLGRPFAVAVVTLDDLASLLPQETCETASDDPFLALIGHDRSLRLAVEKGKAAVLYPRPLHVLLTGPSGVGKTFFAGLMHRFASQHLPVPVPPLVWFNCAEYANNPELLSSHLFGHVKGSFTGAESHKSGLVEQADGGFLLLDEVHRLSGEGQEKLFTLMDKGEYRPLGASGTPRKASVRFICATTEPTTSALLRTFKRRIQVTLDFPPVRQRSAGEQIALVMHFLQQECRKIDRIICIDKALFLWLLMLPLEGNIGQLNGEIQFLCAQSWARAMPHPPPKLVLDKPLQYSPARASVQNEYLLGRLFAQRQLLEITPYPAPFAAPAIPASASDSEENEFYYVLSHEYTHLRNSNVPPNETLAIIRQKLNDRFGYELYRQPPNEMRPPDDNLEGPVADIAASIGQLLGFPLAERLRDALRRHLQALIRHTRDGLIPQLYSASLIAEHCRADYDNAIGLTQQINTLLQITCPASERVWLCLFLRECRRYRQRHTLNPECGVVIIAHGTTTATSMAEYVNQVMECTLFSAIDMPFSQSVHDTLTQLIALITRQQYQRLILLVDTGSLVHFAAAVSSLFQIEVLLLPGITLPAMLETGLELSYGSDVFRELVPSLQEKGIAVQLRTPGKAPMQQVVIICCITGTGTADKIKNVLEESFAGLLDEHTRLLTMDYDALHNPLRLQQALNTDERLAGIIGTFQSRLPDVPFLSLEELFSEQGPELVLGLLSPGLNQQERLLTLQRCSRRFINALSLESIITLISVLNPRRLLAEMQAVLNTLISRLNLQPGSNVTLRFLIHCCCMVERLVINRKSLHSHVQRLSEANPQVLSVIKDAFHSIESSYAIRLSDAEYIFIWQILCG